MKIFKRTKAKKDAHIARWWSRLKAWLRLKEKVARINKVAGRNMKTTTVITISILMLSLIVGSWLTLTGRDESEGMLEGVTDVKPMFDGMHRIQRAKDMQVDQTTELTNKGQQLKHELDSLVALPNKTHRDSMDIVIKYKQLELVVKYLDNK